MISKITHRNNINQLVDYINNDKENGIENRADYVSANVLAITRQDIKNDFKENETEYSQIKGKLPSKEATHIILSFDNKENLDKEKLEHITQEYLDKMGYGNNPFYAVVHNDTENQHIHIATTKIKYDNTLTNTSNEKYKGLSICKELENQFNLQPNTRKFRQYTKDDFSSLPEITQDKLDELGRTKQYALKKLCKDTGKNFTQIKQIKDNIHFVYKQKNGNIGIRLKNNTVLSINKNTLKATVSIKTTKLNSNEARLNIDNRKLKPNTAKQRLNNLLSNNTNTSLVRKLQQQRQQKEQQGTVQQPSNNRLHTVEPDNSTKSNNKRTSSTGGSITSLEKQYMEALHNGDIATASRLKGEITELEEQQRQEHTQKQGSPKKTGRPKSKPGM